MNPKEQQEQRVAAANAALALATQRLDQVERESAAMRSRMDRNSREVAALKSHLTQQRGALGVAAKNVFDQAPTLSAEEDGDLARALALSAEEDAALIAALALSLADAAAPLPLCALGSCPEELESRKQYEEMLTAQVLGDVECLQVDAAELGDGSVRIGTQAYRRAEHGSAYGGHSNLCFYLAAAAGHGPLALQLKAELSPDATALSRAIGANTDFTALAARADTEVVRMYVLRRKATAVVYNSRARVATTYWTAGSLGATVYLHTDGDHYQRLVPA